MSDKATERYFKKLNRRREKYLQSAKSNPKSYRNNVRLMAVIMVLIPTLFLASVIGFLTFDVSAMFNENRDAIFGHGAKFGLAFVIFSIFNALRVSIGQPEGEEIFSDQAPELFMMIETVRQAVNGPPVDRVFISSDLNACITQPRQKTKFWKTENHLTLGLPLLNLLNHEETMAVIAHEFGHFCAGDGKLGNKLYRASITVERLQDRYETEGAMWVEMPLAFFINHFGEKFIDRIFPLIREQEYAADAMAAQVTSPQALASALIRLQIGANYLARVYWPFVKRSTFQSEGPNIRPIEDNAAALCNVVNWQEKTRWMNAGLLQETDYEDTHPVLSKRLEALNVNAFYPQHHNQPASGLLGSLYAPLAKQFDDKWQSDMNQKWAENYKEGKDMQIRYQDLLQSAQSAPLSLEDSIELAEISNRIFDAPVLYGNLNYLINQHAQVSEAWLYAGQTLLKDGQPQCISYLQHAADLNSDYLSIVHGMMAQHYREMGDTDALKAVAA